MRLEAGCSRITIGTPDPNVRAYIVDRQMQPVPVGVPGELLLSGPRLALGYVGRPDLTAAAFIPNPFYEEAARQVAPQFARFYERAYRTGDLARWLPNGSIDCLGRIDNQVKVNGVRLELGEVEAVLSSAPGAQLLKGCHLPRSVLCKHGTRPSGQPLQPALPVLLGPSALLTLLDGMPLVGVEAAFAAAKPDGSGGKRVIGYVCPLSVDVAVVLDTCRARLVSAAVPTLIVPLERLPMLPNGKVDMKALPDVAPSATEVSPTCCPLSALVLLSTGTSTALGIQ